MEMDRKIRNSDEGQKMVAIGGLQNMAWAADTSKFGFKMLVKMGWSAGKGVGKDLQGQISHVKIARRSENLGLGCSLKQAEVQGWSNTAQSFADVLASLNKSYRNSGNLLFVNILCNDFKISFDQTKIVVVMRKAKQKKKRNQIKRRN
jgi:Pin2-interacting protein X1